MKRILFFLLTALLMASCTSLLPGQITRLADKVEAKGANFTEAQWQKANAKFEKLVQEYMDNYSSFKKDQKKEINKAIAKYSATALKYGVGNVADTVKDIAGDLEGILDSAKGFLEGLGL